MWGTEFTRFHKKKKDKLEEKIADFLLSSDIAQNQFFSTTFTPVFWYQSL
jgi:hypothetical protein